MSFTTEKEKPVSNKIVLAEIDMGRKQVNWLNYCAGIWYYRFNTLKKNQDHSFLYGNFLFGPFLSSGTGDSGINFTPFDVGSCIVDGEGYTEQASIADVVNPTNNKSWYYDRDETEFYIHVDGFDDPRNHIIVVGLTLALSNKAKHINGGYYEPRIKGMFVISKSKDPLEFGIIRMDGGSTDLDNKDGFFDDFTDSIVFGQPTDIKYGIDDIDGTEMDYADYKQVGKFYIDDIDIGWPDCRISLIDYRDLFSKKIPTNVFDQTTFSDLKNSNVGKSIPLPWGQIYGFMPICTNEEGSTPFRFQLADVTDHADGIVSIDKVVVETTDVTGNQVDHLADGYFTLTSTYYTPGQKVYVDFKGFDDGLGAMDDNSLDVIEDILNTYLSIPYNATYYDTTEWAAIKDSTKDIGFILDKPTEIKKIIENIQRSNFGGFIVHDDGKYTFRQLDRTAAADETVLLNEYFTPPRIRYIRSRYLSKVSIGYAKDHDNNDYRWYLKDDLEADIVAEYKKSKWKEIETYLTNATDAQWLAEKYMDLWGKVRGEISTQTGIQNSEFEIDDVKNLTLDRRDRGWKGPLKTEIIGLKKDMLGTGKVTITGLVLED